MVFLNPIPYIVINGEEMPVTVNPTGVVVLDDLNIKWGRSYYLDSTTPGSMSLRILDTVGDWVRSQEFLGLEIQVGLRYTDEDAVARDYKIFRGRITEAECVVRNTDEATGTLKGFIVYLRASDKLAELGNRYFSNQSIGAHYYSDRTAYIMAGSGVSSVIAGIGGAYGSAITFMPKAFDQMSALELIEESMAAGGDFINYDPDTNRVEASGRVELNHSGLELQLMPSGLYGIAVILGDDGNNVDAGKLTALSGIKRTIGSGITEVRYEYYLTDGGGGFNKSTIVLATGLSETTYGRRVYTVRTENRTNASTYANIYLDNALDANTWEAPEFEWDTRRTDAGFTNHKQITNFISGREYRNAMFFSRNIYNPFPSKQPVYRVIGGTMNWRSNGNSIGWVVRPNLGPVVFTDPYTQLTWNTINPAVSPVLGWDDLDDSVTWDDISRVGEGI